MADKQYSTYQRYVDEGRIEPLTDAEHAGWEAAAVPRKPYKQEAIERATGTIEGAVWVLLQAGVPLVDIRSIVDQAAKEYAPAETPAFVFTDETDEQE
jgi:hypothetical protein